MQILKWHGVAATSSRSSEVLRDFKTSATSAGVNFDAWRVLWTAWFSHVSVENHAVPGCSPLCEMKSRTTQCGRANRAKIIQYSTVTEKSFQPRFLFR